MVHTSPQTAESFSQLFDCHGDSYREPATEESLRTVFGMITEMASARVTDITRPAGDTLTRSPLAGHPRVNFTRGDSSSGVEVLYE